MTPRRLVLTCAFSLIVSIAYAQTSVSRIGTAFEKFWNAKSPQEAGRAVDDVVNSGVRFDEAYSRLKKGRAYDVQPTGVVKRSYKGKDGVEYFYALNVPANYTPARRYPVRFQLHGGVGGRENNQPRGTGESPLQGADQIYVVPYAWNTAPWWSNEQVVNLASILDSIKRSYNIDDNRVVISGVSDGGTGAYYIGMRDTTPYASFLPLNGFIMVVANGDIDDGEIFPNNLRNKPLFVINGGKDPLYPVAEVEPFVKHLMNEVAVEYHPKPEAGHNTAWWPEMKNVFEDFVAAHPRDPHPEKLTWETASIARNRAHWLVIDSLSSEDRNAPALPDLNSFTARYRLFSRPKPTGRVDLVRNGNTVQATTRGVSAFTLLLSPDVFDFNKPVKVIANGRSVFDGRVERDTKTLMKWAARDNDKAMLYGAELHVNLSLAK